MRKTLILANSMCGISRTSCKLIGESVPERTERGIGAANYCPFSGEGRFVYIGKLLKVHISPEAFSLDHCMYNEVFELFFMNK